MIENKDAARHASVARTQQRWEAPLKLSNVQEQRGVNLTSETQRTIKKRMIENKAWSKTKNAKQTKNGRKQRRIENKERLKTKNNRSRGRSRWIVPLLSACGPRGLLANVFVMCLTPSVWSNAWSRNSDLRTKNGVGTCAQAFFFNVNNDNKK